MKKKVLAVVLGLAIVCSIAGITMAAWDDTKSTGDTLTADEWNAMVADQKSRLPKDGSEAMTGDLNMSGHVINGTDAIKSLPSASLYLWAHGTTQLSCGNGHVTIYGDIYPNGDDQYKCGDSTARWSDIYANNTHWGDLGFTETSYNNRPFKVGDTLVLKVKRFDNETGDTMCIPIPINETPEYKALEQRVEMLEERLEALEGGEE